MPNTRKGLTKKKISAILGICLLILSIIMTFSSKLGLSDFLPSWEKLFYSAGLSDDKQETDSEFSVHFLDVGQGDCIFVKSNGKALLIDSGESSNENKIIDYINKEKISVLDYVIITHPHTDHIGSMAKVIEKIEVKNIIMPEIKASLVPTTKKYENLLLAISKSGANVIKAENGKSFELGNALLQIIAPINDYDDLNNYSVVARLSYGNNSFLFMGDAEKQAESDIIKSGADLRSNVIKIGHHGSSSSTSKELLEIVKPQLAIISCGENNSYGHPDKKVTDLLEKYSVSIKRTDKNGNIVITSDGKNIEVLTER
ncbi:MAG: MBL fold metallo-hydrolase [Clostridiales bacterium]|nr:MBL fold metallo-hydrolase [Clostridiales bacterium]